MRALILDAHREADLSVRVHGGRPAFGLSAPGLPDGVLVVFVVGDAHGRDIRKVQVPVLRCVGQFERGPSRWRTSLRAAIGDGASADGSSLVHEPFQPAQASTRQREDC